MPFPYTLEELAAMKHSLDEKIQRTEDEHPNARPLPPMAEDEAKQMILSFAETAINRTLTTDEAFLIGQLLTGYQMAIEARMLGRKGRYFVISEDTFERNLRD